MEQQQQRIEEQARRPEAHTLPEVTELPEEQPEVQAEHIPSNEQNHQVIEQQEPEIAADQQPEIIGEPGSTSPVCVNLNAYTYYYWLKKNRLLWRLMSMQLMLTATMLKFPLLSIMLNLT